MNNDVIGRILKGSQNVLFSDLLVMLCQVFAIIIIFKLFRRDKLTYHFLTYCLAGFLLFFSGKLLYFFYDATESSARYTETGNVAFAVIEYVVFYYYFKIILNSKILKAFMSVFLIPLLVAASSFVVVVFSIKLADDNILEYSNFIISPELLFLGIVCLFYYLELFRKKPLVKLTQSPSFWIVTSFFFYSLIITPFFIITNDEFRAAHRNVFFTLWTLHYISFSILFIAISNAFLCRKPLTT